jgi:hypothetical protein
MHEASAGFAAAASIEAVARPMPCVSAAALPHGIEAAALAVRKSTAATTADGKTRRSSANAKIIEGSGVTLFTSWLTARPSVTSDALLPAMLTAKSAESRPSAGPCARTCFSDSLLAEGWKRKIRLAPMKDAAMWHME